MVAVRIRWLRMAEESKSLDILGIKPIGDAVNKLAGATVDGASAFLSRICLPAAEEFGLLLRDRVREWRATNLATIVLKSEAKLNETSQSSTLHAHPRLVSNILEHGSWIDDPVVQDLWAGLLTSSCTETGDDDSNLLFVNILAELTKLQARILNYVCESAKKQAMKNGLLSASSVRIELSQLTEITGEKDIYRLDTELDHLRELGLIHGGFEQFYTPPVALASPTAIALHMYVRCHGGRKSPLEYFSLEIPKSPEPPAEIAES